MSGSPSVSSPLLGDFSLPDHCRLSRGKPVGDGLSLALLPVVFHCGFSQCMELLEVSWGQISCCLLKAHSAFEVLPFYCVFITASFPAPCNCVVQAGGGCSRGACGGMFLKQPSPHAGPRGRHPPTEGPQARAIGNQETRIVLKALNLTALVIHVHFLHMGKKAIISTGNEKNVLVIVYNNPTPSFQSNAPSLVFHLPGLLALSLPLPLALSSAEVLCPGNRTGNDVVGRGRHRASSFLCPPLPPASSQMSCMRLLACGFRLCSWPRCAL